MSQLVLVSNNDVDSLKNLHLSTQEFLGLCKDFVMPSEKSCLTLMEKIIRNQDQIHAFVDPEKMQIFGIVAQAGKTLYPCFPHKSPQILEAVYNFLSNIKPFCIIGDRNYVDFVQQIYGDRFDLKPEQINEYILMEMGQPFEFSLTDSVIIRICTQKDEENLFPLQVNYTREEVLPPWVQTYAPVERMNIAKILKERFACCIIQNGNTVSKGHISAVTDHCMQIGGVYTMPSARRQGFAQAIVTELARHATEENKKAVLFVKEKNTAAYHAYQNAGFIQIGLYRSVYYR